MGSGNLFSNFSGTVNLLALLGVAVFFLCLALVFRRTLGTLEKPRVVMEKPPLPKGLADVVLRLEKWRAEGRISREDYERFMHLCREDAETQERNGSIRQL